MCPKRSFTRISLVVMKYSLVSLYCAVLRAKVSRTLGRKMELVSPPATPPATPPYASIPVQTSNSSRQRSLTSRSTATRAFCARIASATSGLAFRLVPQVFTSARVEQKPTPFVI